MSVQSIKTKERELVELTRKIRPFRMAIINVTQAGVAAPTYRYIFNEFGPSLIAGVTYSDAGIYEFAINSGSFYNLTNVIQESNLISTAITSPILTSSFTNSTKAVLAVSTYNITEGTFEDLSGELLIYIKEFYGN